MSVFIFVQMAKASLNSLVATQIVNHHLHQYGEGLVPSSELPCFGILCGATEGEGEDFKAYATHSFYCGVTSSDSQSGHRILPSMPHEYMRNWQRLQSAVGVETLVVGFYVSGTIEKLIQPAFIHVAMTFTQGFPDAFFILYDPSSKDFPYRAFVVNPQYFQLYSSNIRQKNQVNSGMLFTPQKKMLKPFQEIPIQLEVDDVVTKVFLYQYGHLAMSKPAEEESSDSLVDVALEAAG